VAGTVSPHPIASATASGSLPPAGVLDANEEVVQATPRVADKASRVSESSASGANAGGFKVDFGKTGGAGAASAAAESKADLKVQAAAKPESKPTSKPETKAAAPDKAKDEADKARALLDGKDPAKTTKTNEERLVIQVGAYTDATKVREARQKLENAGIKTYTQVIEGKDGKRTRVRVGPFDSKEEADKNAQKIRKLQLEASILKL
jgi:DedD protein